MGYDGGEKDKQCHCGVHSYNRTVYPSCPLHLCTVDLETVGDLITCSVNAVNVAIYPVKVALQ